MAACEIFLSYAHDDKDVAHRFAAAFEAQGYSVWWDDALRSGEAFDQAIEEALRAAKAVVVLWSPSSVTSRWVRAEATIAERMGTFVPVRIAPCELPIMFELTHTADLSGWRGNGEDRGWQVFIGGVGRKTGRENPRPDVSASAPTAAPTIAGVGVPLAGVLPFTFRGVDDEFEFLAEDLTEDVTRALAENDYFKVIAAGTMAAWRGKAVDLRAIAQELDAAYLAEGRLQKSDDRIRLTVQLINTDTTNAIWSHRYVTSAAEIAENPEDFALMVGTQLAEQVIQAEMKRSVAKSEPWTAWERVMRVASLRMVHGAGGLTQLLEESRAAVDAAPGFGLAHAELAFAKVLCVNNVGGKLDDATRREIRHHINRALQLDGDNTGVLLLIVNTSTMLGDAETSLRLARRMVELRPCSPRGYAALGAANMLLGRTGEALDAYAAQLRCRGFDNTRSIAWFCISWCHLLEGRVQEASEAVNEGLALNPQALIMLRMRAITQALLGEEDSAMATIRQVREIEPSMTFDQHLGYFASNQTLFRRMGGHIETFRRLWAATEPAA